MKESRMFEGLTTCLNYCLEMGLDDEAQVIEAFIKTWDKMDYYGKKNICVMRRPKQHGILLEIIC